MMILVMMMMMTTATEVGYTAPLFLLVKNCKSLHFTVRSTTSLHALSLMEKMWRDVQLE